MKLTRPANALAFTLHGLPLQVFGLVKGAIQSFWRAIVRWQDADGLRMSAAMSFYGILSLAPLLVLMVALMGWWVDRSYIETGLIEQIRGVIGARGADVVKQALTSAKEPSEGITASLVAFGLLLSGATGVFVELQDAFERLWRQGGSDTQDQKWWRSASLRLRGVAYILALGFLLLVSLVISTLFNVLSGWAGHYVPFETLAWVLNEVVSVAFCIALFLALMKMSRGPKPGLRYLVMGAAVGAVLFQAGKYVMAFYLSTAAVVSAYGAAGSLVVILMWIYFSSAVLLLSASVARVWNDEACARQAKAAAELASEAHAASAANAM